MNEEIRQTINSFIYHLSSMEIEYEERIKQFKKIIKKGRSFSGNLLASLVEEREWKNFARSIGSDEYERRIQYSPETDFLFSVNSEFERIKTFLKTISVKDRGKNYYSGEKYIHRLEANTIGSKPKQKSTAAKKLLRELIKKEIVFSNDVPSIPSAPKPAKNIGSLEQINIAKKNMSNPESAITHVRAAIGLLLQAKFGFDVTSLPKFAKLCNDCGVLLPRFLETFYDMGSKNIHQGRAPSSSDIKSAIAFVEGFEEELKAIPISNEKLNEIRKKCEIKDLIFKEKNQDKLL